MLIELSELTKKWITKLKISHRTIIVHIKPLVRCQ